MARTMTPVSLDIITEQLMKARDEAAHYQELYENNFEAYRAVAAEYEAMQTRSMYFALGSLCAGVCVGAAGAGLLARHRFSYASVRLAQELTDSRRRAATELSRAKKFGGEGLAKSLIPALDAMDAMCSNIPTDDKDAADVAVCLFIFLSPLSRK